MKATKCACKGSFLDKFIQPAILTVLYQNEDYGFIIYKKLLDSGMVSGHSIDPTGLYRTLKKMEEGGLLSSHWDVEGASQPRRIYAITENGKSCLATWQNTLQEYRDSIDLLIVQIRTTLPEGAAASAQETSTEACCCSPRQEKE